MNRDAFLSSHNGGRNLNCSLGGLGSLGAFLSTSVAMGCCPGLLAPLASVAVIALPFLDDPHLPDAGSVWHSWPYPDWPWDRLPAPPIALVPHSGYGRSYCPSHPLSHSTGNGSFLSSCRLGVGRVTPWLMGSTHRRVFLWTAKVKKFAGIGKTNITNRG